jgi:hypothetical protein
MGGRQVWGEAVTGKQGGVVDCGLRQKWAAADVGVGVEYEDEDEDEALGVS